MKQILIIRGVQERIAAHYAAMKYSQDALTITVGLMEEAGEIAHAVQNMNPIFTPTPHRTSGDSIGRELVDALVYIFALANMYHVDLEQEIGIKFARWYAKEMAARDRQGAV